MMTELQFDKINPRDLGYWLSPPRRPTEPGCPRLDMSLSDIPSLHHFDPDQLLLHVVSPDGGLETLKVTHPWLGAHHWQICVGPLDLLDRKGKHVDLYTFGGDLHIETSDTLRTHLTLISEAPILLAQSYTSPVSLLIQEVEIQLAQLRAEWCCRETPIDHCLACLAPFDLYRMCLVAVLERFEHMAVRDESIFKLSHILISELAEVGLPAMQLRNLKV